MQIFRPVTRPDTGVEECEIGQAVDIDERIVRSVVHNNGFVPHGAPVGRIEKEAGLKNLVDGDAVCPDFYRCVETAGRFLSCVASGKKDCRKYSQKRQVFHAEYQL